MQQDVKAIVESMVSGIKAALGENLEGIYLPGSLALGDFNLQTSDIDFLVVPKQPLSEAEFVALVEMHSTLFRLPNPFAQRLEGSYIHTSALLKFEPHERLHPALDDSGQLRWATHRDNWIIERWAVRENGLVLLGPDPKTLIEPVSDSAIRLAVKSELELRVQHWAGQPGLPDWLLPRYYQAFEVETICRALYTLEFGELPSKPKAVAWAREALPAEWRTIVERSQQWRSDSTPDPNTVPEVKRFACWAAEQANRKATYAPGR